MRPRLRASSMPASWDRKGRYARPVLAESMKSGTANLYSDCVNTALLERFARTERRRVPVEKAQDPD